MDDTCPVRVSFNRPEAVSNSLMVRSEDPVAKYVFCGSNVAQCTQPRWLEMTRYGRQGGCHRAVLETVGFFSGTVTSAFDAGGEAAAAGISAVPLISVGGTGRGASRRGRLKNGCCSTTWSRASAAGGCS